MSKAYDHLVTKINLARVFYKAPAVMAVVVRHSGSYVLSALKGVRKADLAETAAGNKVADDDTFLMHSCSKPISGYLLAVLLKLTKYDWRTTIGEVFPELSDAACRKHFRIRDDYLGATIRDMMSHTARFLYTPDNGTYSSLTATGMLGGFDERQLDEYCSRDAEMRRRYNYALTSQQDEPGPVGVYNGGPILPTAMLERVTGKSYQALMREYVFDPLGMNSAGVGRASTDAATPDGVWAHYFDFNSLKFLPNPFFSSRVVNYDAHSPAGGVHFAASDAAKFISANLVNYPGDRPLEGTWLEETFPVFANGCSVSGWLSSGPVNPDLTVSHDGDAPGSFRARVVIRPYKGEGYAVCANGSGIGVMDGKPDFDIGLHIADAVGGAIEEMLADWGAMFPGE
jgi:CubicO group peptidase (beta-lactamase class C family)